MSEQLSSEELNTMVKAFNDYAAEVENLKDLADGFETLSKTLKSQIDHIKSLASLELDNPVSTTQLYKYIESI